MELLDSLTTRDILLQEDHTHLHIGIKLRHSTSAHLDLMRQVLRGCTLLIELTDPLPQLAHTLDITLIQQSVSSGRDIEQKD